GKGRGHNIAGGPRPSPTPRRREVATRADVGRHMQRLRFSREVAADLLAKTGLHSDEVVIAPGEQSGCPDDAGPVRALVGSEARSANYRGRDCRSRAVGTRNVGESRRVDSEPLNPWPDPRNSPAESGSIARVVLSAPGLSSPKHLAGVIVYWSEA